MKRQLFLLCVSSLISSCSLWHACFTDPSGIYMTEEENLGGRLELQEDNKFWYYWETKNDTFGTSHGLWDKKFNKITLNSIDTADELQQEPFNLLRSIYNDSISYQVVQVVDPQFFPLYRTAWIVKRGYTVLSSGLTDKDGRFYTEYRARDSIILSYNGYHEAALVVGAGAINDIQVQMLKGGGGKHVYFEDVKFKIRKKELELLEGGEASFLGEEFKKYFRTEPSFWPWDW